MSRPRYTDYDDLIHGLDTESLLDDPLLGTFDDEDLALLNPGGAAPRPKPAPVKSKGGRPKKKKPE